MQGLARSLTILVIIAKLSSTIAVAQSDKVILNGSVSDIDGTALPFATIAIKNTSKGTVADENGFFSLHVMRLPAYLVVSSLGYKPKEITIGTSLSNSKIKIKLEPKHNELEQIEVRARSAATELKLSAKAVQVIETAQTKALSTDLAEVLSKSEGVNVQKAGGLGSNMRFSLNGLTDDQIRFFLDDVPLEFSPYSMGLANIPINLIQRLEIYKGVLPIQFGSDALGGGVNVVSNPIKPGFHTDLSYQTGSFNTHRSTISMAYKKNNFFISANGFYDFSANNYKVDVQVVNELGKKEDATVRRFNDAYSAYGTNLKIGVKDRKTIKELSLTAYYNDLYKQVQHNAIMSGAPFGEVYRKRNSKGVIGKADFNLSKKWTTDNSFGFSSNEREFADTSAWLYNWYGERVIKKDNPNASETAENRKSRLFIWDNNILWRNKTTFRLNETYKLTLAIAPTYNIRTGDELFSGTWDAATTKSNLLTWVNSIDLSIKKTKWENNFFVKQYIQIGESEEPLPADLGSKTIRRKEKLWGFGNVFAFYLNDRLTLKPSYEYAVRLPRPDEIFGDGAFTSDNLALKPENSHNFNFQIIYASGYSSNYWEFQTNLFGRIVDDLILLIPNNDRSALYENVFSANSLGVELGFNTKLFQEKLRLSANSTLQHFYNNSMKGQFASYYGDRIPNRPYFFANGAIQYDFNNLLNNDNKLSVYWNIRYVHSYFLTWESLGTISSKATIPYQAIQNIGLTYQQWFNNKLISFSIESPNITNQKVYDFYGVQKPGRALYLKINYNF